MRKLFKNMLPYWHIIVVIFLLLGVQAYCDLSLPQYTSDIIDVGIQNKGIKHILPEKMPEEEYQLAELFMTDGEKDTFEAVYEKKDDTYVCTADKETLETLDDELLTPIVLTYRMANMSETDFKNTIAEALEQNPQNQITKESLDEMSIEEIGQMMQMELTTYEAENDDGEMVTYVDMRPMMKQLIASGAMTQDGIAQSREYMENMIDSVGSSTLHAMGTAYATSCDEKAGLDVEHIQKNYLWSEGGKMAAMSLLMLAVAVVVGYLASRVGAGVGRDLREKIFGKVVGFSNTEMDKFSTASLITRSTNDIQQVQLVFAMIFRIVLYAPILGVGGVLKVLQTDVSMTWILGVAVVAILILVGFLFAVAMPKFKILQYRIDELNLVSREILTGLSVIRAFSREKHEEERFEEVNERLTKTNLFVNRCMTFMMPAMMLIMNGITVLIIYNGSHAVDNGTMQVGNMMAFMQYAMQIIMSFLMITMMSIMLPRASVSAKRINEIMETKVSIESPETAKIPENNKKGEVRFEHVGFAYPGAEEETLSDINFTAQKGETVAFIGSTGSGKSTLVNLIPRFFDVTSGKILVDGVDIREMGLHDLRERIGYVPQKGVLFSGTIDSNIRYGKEDATKEEVNRAAEIAQAQEFIGQKEKGMESEIAQGGTNVSGGQKQRLSIARAIAKNPEIYIFDDSFSALDYKTDVVLRRALKKETKDATTLIVAQRISTILHADKILVLDEGKIVGEGTHKELLKTCEVYQQIAMSQLSKEELEHE